MMNDELITVDLWCREKKGAWKVDVVTSIETVPEDMRGEYRMIRFFMRPLTWKIHTDLISSATVKKRIKGMGGKGKGMVVDEIDWGLYKQNKIVKVVDSWDLTDDNGNKIPVNEETILDMHPDLIETLIDKYDSIVLVSKERQGTLVMSTFKYYNSVYSGSGGVEAPPEVVELSLMEKFNWTPQQIASIPYKKIQELFIILNQRDDTQSQTQETRNFIASNKKG